MTAGPLADFGEGRSIAGGGRPWTAAAEEEALSSNFSAIPRCVWGEVWGAGGEDEDYLCGGTSGCGDNGDGRDCAKSNEDHPFCEKWSVCTRNWLDSRKSRIDGRSVVLIATLLHS